MGGPLIPGAVKNDFNTLEKISWQWRSLFFFIFHISSPKYLQATFNLGTLEPLKHMLFCLCAGMVQDKVLQLIQFSVDQGFKTDTVPFHPVMIQYHDVRLCLMIQKSAWQVVQ